MRLKFLAASGWYKRHPASIGDFNVGERRWEPIEASLSGIDHPPIPIAQRNPPCQRRGIFLFFGCSFARPLSLGAPTALTTPPADAADPGSPTWTNEDCSYSALGKGQKGQSSSGQPVKMPVNIDPCRSSARSPSADSTGGPGWMVAGFRGGLQRCIGAQSCLSALPLASARGAK